MEPQAKQILRDIYMTLILKLQNEGHKESGSSNSIHDDIRKR